MQKQIPSDISSLNELSRVYPWIPNENSIRPSPEVMIKKCMFNQHIQRDWPSLKGYIEQTIFRTRKGWIFEECMFPYNTKGKHFVLWHTDFPFTIEPALTNQPEEEVNKEIKKYVKGEFVWYINPKPTVLEFYHVQVFFP
jgi:hypothetical protein